MKLDKIDKVIQSFIKDQKLYVLRNVKTGAAVNVSYTEEGLMWSSNATGKLIYFVNAKLARKYDKDGNVTNVYITGDTRPNPDLVVEKFIPTDQPTTKAQVTEYTWTSKGYRLLYHTS